MLSKARIKVGHIKEAGRLLLPRETMMRKTNINISNTHEIIYGNIGTCLVGRSGGAASATPEL